MDFANLVSDGVSLGILELLEPMEVRPFEIESGIYQLLTNDYSSESYL